MTVQQHIVTVDTLGRGMINVTNQVAELVISSSITTGLCHLFLHHTSASLILCENADPAVQQDLEVFMSKLAPDGNPLYTHQDEGPDDMPSHIRTILTQNFLSIPITKKQLALGTWQGLYLWEHRLAKHQRKMTVTMMG